MQLEVVEYADLYNIGHLQPDGWPDIVIAFKFYIDSNFCIPIKAVKNNKIIGLGACTTFRDTAWLAHIIVSQEHRNQGIGYKIVDRLLKCIQIKSIKTSLLIATELGFPVYIKAGFRKVTEYQFFKREEPLKAISISSNIKNFESKFRDELFQLDKRITGEDRSKLFSEHLENTYIYLNNNKLQGYYIPDLCEGPIIAETEEAGIGLMKLKYSKIHKATLPSENIAGIELLKQLGFKISPAKGTRMILGKDIMWYPEKIYSRISGNFG